MQFTILGTTLDLSDMPILILPLCAALFLVLLALANHGTLRSGPLPGHGHLIVMPRNSYIQTP